MNENENEKKIQKYTTSNQAIQRIQIWFDCQAANKTFQMGLKILPKYLF